MAKHQQHTLINSISNEAGSSSNSMHLEIDDDFEDACSICLEPFIPDDPSSGTTCKHEYHLHCILEWSQRSKECPICWQTLALKDPASQELLAAAEIERNSRIRRVSTNRTTQESDSYGSHWTDDSDFNERMMQHLAIMMSRARHACRNERQRSSRRSPSPEFTFPSRVGVSPVHPNTPEECNSANGSPGSSSPIVSRISPSLSESPFLPQGDAPISTVYQHSRTPQNQTPHTAPKPKSSELLALSDSIKSKFSAVSARYKDSISKGTQGFREKLLARNSSVKELSKGVQREMTASIAGVARMIERLDLKSKRNTQSGEVPSHSGESSNFFSKGKGVLDHIIANSRENSGVIGLESDLHKKSSATSSISSHKDVPCAERGN